MIHVVGHQQAASIDLVPGTGDAQQHSAFLHNTQGVSEADLGVRVLRQACVQNRIGHLETSRRQPIGLRNDMLGHAGKDRTAISIFENMLHIQHIKPQLHRPIRSTGRQHVLPPDHRSCRDAPAFH